MLVDFWAYSCINCQRELPHVEAWAKDYAADGLVVVGVHTPEYAFEHVPANVAAGVHRLGLTFPVALDNSYDTWNAYDNQSWPASYLVDASGQIRHLSIGEGDYPQQEQNIRQLLLAAHPGLVPAGGDRGPRHDAAGPRPDPGDLPRLPAGAGIRRGGPVRRRAWPVHRTRPACAPARSPCPAPGRSARSRSRRAPDAGITLAFHASKVYLDVGGTGTLTVSGDGPTRTIHVSGAPDIHTVASSAQPADGTVTIRLSPGLRAYSFTFG